MFLTSNRAEKIDPAFESRIDISLNYPKLDLSSRRQIWSQFLRGEKGSAFSDVDLDNLAQVQLNGRQIKNVLKTALLLARQQGDTLNYRYMQTVLELKLLK